MQFGAKPLFENISVKFGGGNRYGLIGANGCGKSTFMKILGRLVSARVSTLNTAVTRLKQKQASCYWVLVFRLSNTMAR
jgi:ATPase subunit of ABC transporter with duplicated ATPase domains